MAVESTTKEPNGSTSENAEKEFDNIRLVVSDSEFPAGKLKITQTDLTWTPSSEAHQPWVIKFIDISLHAISTDESSGYPPCIYAQFGDDCEEFRLIPLEDSRLRELYDALCEGAEKNVDEEQEAGLGGLFGGSSAEQSGLGGAESMLARFDGILQVPAEMEGWADDAEAENGTDEEAGDSG